MLVTRAQLLDLSADDLNRVIEQVPPEIEDEIMLLLADLYPADCIDIPDEYLAGIM